jgi:hypothetical protein
MRFSVSSTASSQHKEFVTGAAVMPTASAVTAAQHSAASLASFATRLNPCLQGWCGLHPVMSYAPATTRLCGSASARQQATAVVRFFNRKPVLFFSLTRVTGAQV